MPNPICPDLAAAALALTRTHPHAPPLDVLDLVMQGMTGTVDDLGGAADPLHPFGQLIAAAFDRGMSPAEWRALLGPQAHPAVATALRGIWRGEVLRRFAERYRLNL